LKIANIYADGHIVYLFLRDGNKLEIKKIDDFYPYFFVPTKNGKYVSLSGKRLKKIVLGHPSEVREEREKYDETYESDVLYRNRFLIDRVDEIEETYLRIWYLDIEIVSSSFADPNKANHPINIIGIYDDILDKYFSFVYLDFLDEDVIDSKSWQIFLFNDERRMYRYFVKFMRKNLPDIVYSWNGDNYDFVYLFNRIGHSLIRKISPLERIVSDKGWYELAGCSFLDMLKLYRYLTVGSGMRESYALDYVAKYELGYGKIDYEFKDKIDDFEDLKDMLRYNRRDVKIMLELDTKISITQFFDNLRRKTKSTWDQVLMNSRMIDNFLLNYAKQISVVLPNRKKLDDSSGKKFKGAFVLEPKKGVSKWVVELDMTSLYPSIMYSMNISPETFIGEEIECSNCIKIDRYRFRKDRDSFLKEVIEYLFNERNRLKKEMKKHEYGSTEYVSLYNQQFAMKALINSLYGYFAFENSRFFDKRLASSVTYTARSIIRFVISLVEDMGYEVIYSDTDSIFVLSGLDNLDDCIELGYELKKKINSSFDSFMKKEFNVDSHIFNIKFEKVYRRIIFLNKKRYSGLLVWDNGQDVDEIEFVGLEVRRSDNPEFIKKLQSLILEKLLREDVSIDYIREFMQEYFNAIKEQDVESIGFPVGVNKDIESYKGNPIHVRAIKYSNKYLSMNITRGDRIRYIFIKKVPRGYPDTDVIAFVDKIPDGFEIDYDRIIERTKMKIKYIVEALGFDYSEFESGLTRNKLF